MDESGCPQWNRVRDLLDGASISEDITWLRQHLGQCSLCARAAQVRAKSAASEFQASERALKSRSPSEQIIGGAEVGWMSAFIDAAEAESFLAANDNPPTFIRPAQAPGEIGRFGNYPVLGVIANSAHGAILLAEDAVRRYVTLHVLHPDLAANDRARRRFLRHAQEMAAISHEHIVPVYHVGEADGLPFLVMPRLEGESLRNRVHREGKLPLLELLRMGSDIAAGLASAHSAGIMHRDLRPDCIWIEASTGRVRILDFGLFRPVPVKGSHLAPDAVPGELPFMSPEQANNQPVDARSDLFSLGCILYFASTGRPPFQAASLLGELMSLQLHTPDPVMSHRPDLPPVLNHLIIRLMAKNPAERPATAADVAAEFRTMTEQLVRVIPDGETPKPLPITAQMKAVAIAAPPTTVADVKTKWPKVAWIAAIIALFVLSVTIYFGCVAGR